MPSDELQFDEEPLLEYLIKCYNRILRSKEMPPNHHHIEKGDLDGIKTTNL